MAVANNAFECAQLVIEAQPGSVNIVDKAGATPLHVAAYTGNLQMAQLLVANQAAVDHADKQQRRPIHWAASRGFLEVYNFLFLMKISIVLMI